MADSNSTAGESQNLDSSDEPDEEPEVVEFDTCLATGIPIPVFESDRGQGQPLALTSAVGLFYLQIFEEIEWVKVGMLKTPAKRQWIILTPQNEDQFEDIGDLQFRHGSVFETDTVKARQSDDPSEVEVRSRIDRQVWLGGAPEDKVTRDMLDDEDVMSAYNSIKDSIDEPTS